MRLFTSTLCIIALFSFVVPATAAAEEKIAVVDMLKLVESHPDTAKLEQTYRGKMQAAEAALNAAKKRVTTLESKIKEAPEGSQQRDIAQVNLDRQLWQSNYDFKRSVFVANRAYLAELELIYVSITRLVQSYAMSNKYTLVLQRMAGELGPKDKNEFILKVVVRTVVYSEARKDITDAIKAMFPKK